MTAEVAVLNRQAIALAADSAVTITHPDGDKVFNSVNKLFALRHAPVAVMIYGEADFMGVPWEPLIKVYRTSLGRKTFPTIEEHAEAFVSFVRHHPLMQTERRQDSTFGRRAFRFLLPIVGSTRTTYKAAEAAAAASSTNFDVAKEVNDALVKALDQHDAMLDQRSTLNDFDPGVVTRRSKMFFEIFDQIFEIFPGAASHVTDPVKQKLIALFTKMMGRDYFTSSSGIVVAGYGDDEMFPSLVNMELDGVYDGFLRYSKDLTMIDDDDSAVLRAFAQRESVVTFMDGIHPRFDTMLTAAIETLTSDLLVDAVVSRMTGLDQTQTDQLRKLLGVAGKAMVSGFEKLTKDFRAGYHGPIIEALQVMPKEELADLAESLVHLTSTRRRVTMETETVGGPIDVAVISKGDGFIWLKRKHYFKPELNPQFFTKMLES